MQLKKIIALSASCLISLSCFAQGSYLRTLAHYNQYSEGKKARLKRYYVGYGIPTLMKLDITTHYVAPGDIAGTPSVLPIDKSQETRVSGVSGYGGEAGTFYILSQTSRVNALCFDIGVSEYFYFYNVGPLNYGSATFSDESVIGIINMPLGLSYKSGGEVSLNKHDRSTLSFGVGMAPYMSIAKIIAADTKFGVRGYASLEIGAFAGIEWKFRATYFTGNLTLVNQLEDPLNNVSSADGIGPMGTMDVKAIISGSLNLSIVILPFSFKWDRDRY